MAADSKRSATLLTLLALLPLLFVALVLFLSRVPDSVVAASVPLSGEWSYLETDGAKDPGRPPTDIPWSRRTIPDSASSPPLTTAVTWIKRTVDLPSSLLGRPLQLHLGGIRAGRFSVFWNGRQIAEEFALGGSTDWTLPPGVVGPSNELAVRVAWSSAGDYGFDDSRWLVGKAEVVGPFFARFEEFSRLVFSGTLFILPFAFAMIWVLRQQAGASKRRRVYSAILVLLPGFGFFLVFMTTSFLPLYVPPRHQLLLLMVSVGALSYGTVNFADWYFQERETRLVRLSRWAFGATLFLAALCAVVGSDDLSVGAYLLSSLYVFVAGTLNIVMMLRVPRREGESPALRYVLLSAFCGYLGSGLLDLGLEAHLHSLPRLFPLSTTNLVVAIICVVIADFISIAQTNKKLSVSLQVTHGELSVALVAAQEAARVKGEFVANISHELRTPLNSILNVPSSLMESFARTRIIHCKGCGSEFEPEGDEALTPATECPECGKQGTLTKQARWRFLGEAKESMRRLQALWRSAMHLLNLVDGVLDFSKIDAGRMTLRVRPVSVHEALLGVAATVSSIAEARRIKLHLVEPAEPFEVQADPLRVSQVLLNLAGNALKFTPEGKAIELGAEQRGDRCHFWVKDQGIGVAPEHHQLIFESFRQVDSSHTRPYGGTGLGLAIAHALVQLHDGRVWVESAVDQGATFHVELPIAGPAPKAEVKVDAAAAARRRVFVASDDPLSLNAVRLALQPLGVSVSVTGTAELGKVPEMIQRQHPDLLILDMIGQKDRALALCAQWARSTRAPPPASEAAMQVLALGVDPAHQQKVETTGAQTLGATWRTEQLAERVMQLLEVR